MRMFGRRSRRMLLCAAAANLIALAAAPARADYFFTDLGDLPGKTSSFATAISPDGQYVAGYSGGSTGSDLFLWSGGTMQDLGPADGLYFKVAGVNDSGQVVGTSFFSSGGSRAFVSNSSAESQALNALGSSVQAYGVNNSGQIVGSADGRGFVYTPGSGALFLPDLPDATGGAETAWAINNAGDVTGWDQVIVQTPPHGNQVESRPFFWSPSGGMTAIPLAIT